MKFFLCLVLFVSLLAPSLAATGTLGQPTTVTANSQTTIDFGLGLPSLDIEVSQDAQVTLSIYVSISVSGGLPPGYESLGFTGAVGVGFTLSVTPSSAVIISASLTTPALTAAAIALITGSASVGCLRFDSNSQSYTEIDIPSYSLLDNTVTVNLPVSGTYVFVAVNLDAQIPTFFGEIRTIQAEVNTTFNYTGDATSSLLLSIYTSSSADLNTTFYSSNPTSTEPSGYISANAYFDFNISTVSTLQAALQFTYDAAAIANAGISETTLQFGYYDEATGKWSFPGNANVDTTTRVLAQSTTHFSTWGVYGTSGTTASSANLIVPVVALIASFLCL